jgi:Flp pilus assembly secretin CpaC
MTVNRSCLTRTIFAAIAVFLARADCTSAAERVARGDSSYCVHNPCPPDSRSSEFDSATSTSVSNDSTSRFVALVVNKSIALDLPKDVADVLVGSPKTADVILRSKRRAFIVAKEQGQTNIFFMMPKVSR